MNDAVLFETLKLLVEVAWADRVIEPAERDLIIGMARQAGAPDHQIGELRAELADPGRLPAPDLELLREHRSVVLDAVDQLIAIDGRVAPDERAARDAVVRLLG